MITEATVSSSGDTRSERRGVSLWITISRPQYSNRLSSALIDEIGLALDRAEADRELRAVVIAADPPVFCLGADLFDMRTLGTIDMTALRFVDRIKLLLDRFESFPKPIIAAVSGDAKAGGFELLLVCDVIVAVEEARIGDAHAGFTLPGAGSVTRSTYRLGASLARSLLLTGDMVPATDLVACGFVRKAVPSGRLTETVDAIVEMLCSKPPAVTRRLKQALRNAVVHPRSAALAQEYALFEEQTYEPEVAEGILRLNQALNKQV